MGIIERIKARDIEVIIFEPELDSSHFLDSPVLIDLDEFKRQSDIIVANRYSASLADVEYKLLSRDLFGDN